MKELHYQENLHQAEKSTQVTPVNNALESTEKATLPIKTVCFKRLATVSSSHGSVKAFLCRDIFVWYTVTRARFSSSLGTAVLLENDPARHCLCLLCLFYATFASEDTQKKLLPIPARKVWTSNDKMASGGSILFGGIAVVAPLGAALVLVFGAVERRYGFERRPTEAERIGRPR